MVPGPDETFDEAEGVDSADETVMQVRIDNWADRSVPGILDASHQVVAASDGSEWYRFDANGRHIATHDMMTGRRTASFSYDSNSGWLASITYNPDSDAETYTIQRGTGSGITIEGPTGRTVGLFRDYRGPRLWTTRVTDDAGNRHYMDYSEDGLLTEFTNRRGVTSYFSYYPDGRLRRDVRVVGELDAEDASDPDDVSITLERFIDWDANEVTVIDTTTEGRMRGSRTHYVDGDTRIRTRGWVESLDESTRSVEFFDDAESMSLSPETRTYVAPDGTVTTATSRPGALHYERVVGGCGWRCDETDSRMTHPFGADVVERETITTVTLPGEEEEGIGRLVKSSLTLHTPLGGEVDMLNVTTANRTFIDRSIHWEGGNSTIGIVRDSTFSTALTGSGWTATLASPSGSSEFDLDASGRPTEIRSAIEASTPVEATSLGWVDGLLNSVSQGDAETRFSYDAHESVQRIETPASEGSGCDVAVPLA